MYKKYKEVVDTDVMYDEQSEKTWVTYEDNDDGKPEEWTVNVQISDPTPVAHLSRREKMDLRLLAERIARSKVEGANEYGFVYSDDYRKKMNLTGDPASWKCYAVHLKQVTQISGDDEFIGSSSSSSSSSRKATSKVTMVRDVGIIIARRKYVPPFGDVSQDFIFTRMGPWKNARQPILNFMLPLERMVDCLAPLNQNYFYDNMVIQCKLDSLMCDEESFTWYQTQLKMVPDIISACRTFLKSIANVLEEEGVEDISSEDLEPDMQTFNDPFEVRDDINFEGVKGGEHADDDAKEAWNRKVSRYLGFCIDGGLHSELRFNDLFALLVKEEPASVESVKMVHQLFDYFLYLRPDGKKKKFDSSVSLWQKLQTVIKGTTSKFAMNERVCIRLMELGYLQYVTWPVQTLAHTHCQNSLSPHSPFSNLTVHERTRKEV
eukprot:TRINITY_DN1166_c0_g1_i7.p1 TRINITY_DN1166_c0_g1~~TRINITY_DN1166_c0_g1_i7.p1  ORF type:complete len:434 (+),score=142.92 TRINITY_DN1166_c0_g1_i7:213-1514(+)